ncbi:hypothetical protein AAFF_G00240940 [Aldrovandia affinis]|uniref:Chromogranin-A n=1 Tax=Aldrovandia affinis TaxID=143900 RepID=A0AAD7SUV2_9TELE|nr:hypothetical protein AAFF_G00240940 [Aldrovandia affinis]
MITRGCVFLALLANCVLSLPVSSHHIEKEDIKVMKCIVEVITDALSKPHPIPVSQDCLDSLGTDKRLISILRRQNFLKELQEIAMEGASERALLQSEGRADHVTGGPTGLAASPDRSMLAFMETPGERAAVAEKREKEEESMENEGESQEENEIRGNGGREEAGEEPDNHISNSLNKEEEETHASLEGDAEKEGDGYEDTRVKHEGETEPAGEALGVKPQKEEQIKGEEEEPEGVQKAVEDRRDSEGSPKRKEEEEEEDERGLKFWSETDEHAARPSSRKWAEGDLGGGAMEADTPRGLPQPPQETPHHSKEADEEVEEEEETHRSPEALELQMIARRETEEGSANRKTEDHEVESLAAIESELESMAQKLHELRRG